MLNSSQQKVRFLGKRWGCMDCRVKPGNDEGKIL
jgi:hypothetical protein